VTDVSRALIARIACARFDSLEGFAAPAAVEKARAWTRAAAGAEHARRDLADRLYVLAGEPSSDPARARARFGILRQRRAVHRGAVDAAAIAALPGAGKEDAAAAQALARLETAERRSRDELEEALAEAARTAARTLELLVADPVFAEGLWLVGPALHAGALRLTSGRARHNARSRRVADTVAEYAVRAATKTSPQGVFCATASAAFGACSALEGDARPARLSVRINVAEARKLLRFQPVDDSRLELDPALVRGEDAFEFWRAETGAAGEDTDRHVRIKAGPALDALVALLEDAPRGAVERGELAAWAVARMGEGARPWLERIASAGLLRPCGALPFDEPRPLRRAARARTKDALAFEHIEARLDEAGGEPDPARRVRTYEAVRSELAALPACPELDLDGALRVDAAAALTATVDLRHTRELARVVPAYARWFAALYPRRLLLDPWVRRFLAVVGPEREVSLATLVHGTFDEPGSAARASFPDPSALGLAGLASASARDAHARREAWIERRLEENAGEIGLDDADWSHLAGDTAPPRFACGVLFQEDAARMVLNALYGPGLAAARFARLHDGEAAFAATVRKAATSLASPGAVIAEIAYRHGGRTANAGLHPRVFPHVIVLPGEDADPEAEPIPLRDLFVRWDEGRERFALRSRRLDREVVPLLANGLSPDGFVAFLVAIGQQDAQPLAWFRDLAPRRAGPVPRVACGDTVLFRRRWQWTPADTARILDPAEAPAVRFARVQEWREQAGAPRHVFVDFARRAKPVHFDLTAPGRIEALARSAAEFGAPTVREMWPVPTGDGPAGHAVEYLADVLDAGERA